MRACNRVEKTATREVEDSSSKLKERHQVAYKGGEQRCQKIVLASLQQV